MLVSCVSCFARSPFKYDDPDEKKLRTFGQLRKLSEDYKVAKLKKKSTKEADFFNVIKTPLFEGCSDDAIALDVLTIPGRNYLKMYDFEMFHEHSLCAS